MRTLGSEFNITNIYPKMMGRIPCGCHYCATATKRGIDSPSHHQNLGERQGIDPPSQTSEGITSASALIWGLWNTEVNQ